MAVQWIHRTACSRAVLLRRRGFAIDSSVSRGRRSCGVLVMDLVVRNAHDAPRRRLASVWRRTAGGGSHPGLGVCQTRTLTGLPWLRPDARRNAPIRRWSVPDPVHLSCRRPMVQVKARSEPLVLWKRVSDATRSDTGLQWAFAASLLGLRVGGGADGNVLGRMKWSRGSGVIAPELQWRFCVFLR